jgi:hypothetical protein
MGFCRPEKGPRTISVFSSTEYRKWMERRSQTWSCQTCQVVPLINIPEIRGGDVVLFAVSLGILMGLFEKAPESVTGGTVRKTLSWIGGSGFVDPVPQTDETRRSVVATSNPDTTTEDIILDYETESVVQGSAVLGSLDSLSGEDVGEGVRVLDDDMVKSPAEI